MENLALIDSFSEFKDDKLIDRVTLMVILEDVLIDIPYPSPMMKIENLEEERVKESRLFPLLPASVERLSLNGCGR